MHILITTGHLVLILGTLFLFYRQQGENIFKKSFLLAVILKMLAGFAFGVTYSHYFGSGDTIQYYQAALHWEELFHQDFRGFICALFGDSDLSGYFTEQPRAITFVKVLGILLVVTHGSYWLAAGYFVLFSLLTGYWLFRQLDRLLPGATGIWFLAVFGLPGILFWSSGIIKESITVSAMYILLAVFLDSCRRRRIFLLEYLLPVLLAIMILVKLKYYVAAVFIPFYLLAYFRLYLFIVKEQISFKHNKRPWVILLLLLCGTAVFVVLLSPNFYPGNLMNRIVEDNSRLLAKSSAGSIVQYHNLEPTYMSFLYNTPVALFSGLFRPLPWEGTYLLPIIAGFQNLLLLLLTGLMLIRTAIKNFFSVNSYVVIALGFVLIMATFLALSTPNFGTLERFKVLYQPVFTILLAYLYYRLESFKKSV